MLKKPLRTLAEDLAQGRTTARILVEECLARIDDPAGEGARTFLAVDGEGAREAADFHDRQRRRGVATTPFAGIPVSIKDLFDVQGQVTRAGSKILADAPPAGSDAPAVARLRAAGFVPIGRTAMTEFAYSGIGLNPHYGTPRNPYDRAAGRVPGGSSAGAAVSVTDGMAAAALGTDTGGSCRIPAAFCGLVGFKPTARRIPLAGAVPLSPTLDSVGPLARTVECCAVLDAVLSGERSADAVLPARSVAGLRFVVPQSFVLDDMDATVAQAFAAALSALSAAGARIVEAPFRELLDLPAVNAKGGFAAAEAYAWHRRHLESRTADYDPRVRARILKGQEQSAADYLDLLAARADLMERIAALTAPFDAVLMPTVAIVAPTIAELASDAAFTRANLLALRNTAVANFLDVCAISLPAHRPGEAPVGLMLMGRHGADLELLSIAAAAAAALPAGATES